MNIQLTDFAYEDIAAIKDYIKKDSVYYANNFVERIFSAMEKLKDFQQIGRIVPEVNRDNIREILFHDYRIIYKVDPDIISIIGVIHGSRSLEKQKDRFQ